MKKIFVLAFFLVQFAFAAEPQCSKELFFNSSDSLLIDTCANNSIYSKKNYLIVFNDNVYPFNSVIQYTDTFTIDDMSGDFPSIKEQFLDIVQQIGTIHFIRVPKPLFDYSDSLQLIHPVFGFYLDDYQKVDSVISLLSSIDSVKKVNIHISYCPTMGVPLDRALNTKYDIGNVFSGTSTNYLKNFKPLGFQTEIYQINCPLAWEITYGSPDVFLAIGDATDKENITTHLDLNAVQNLNHYNPGYLGDSPPLFQKTELLAGYLSHMMKVASCAKAGKNSIEEPNTTPTQMVGTAPNCRFVTFPSLSYSGQNDMTKANEYDLDGIQNNFIKTPQVQNISFGVGQKDITGGSKNVKYDGVEAVMNDGIIVVAAAGNQRNSLNSDGDNNMIITQGTAYWYPSKVYPAANVFNNDNNDPSKDFKPIAVAGVKPGKFVHTLNQSTCEDILGEELYYFARHNINEPSDPYYDSKPHYTNELQFADIYNFSPGKDKFSSGTNWNLRKTAQENAFVDLVAPSRGNMVAIPNSTSNGSYTFDNGTSFATPLVSGIASLMVSVNHDPTNNNTRLGVTGADVQRKAYNILTFTAKKIPDGYNQSTNNLSGIFRDGNDHQVSGSFPMTFPGGTTPYQLDYQLQSNDLLKRWWAQRMGFGLVNAYRAVAHSIGNKGHHTYYPTDNSTFSNSFITGNGNVNSDGQKLMHFGSWVNFASSPVSSRFEIDASRKTPNTATGEFSVLTYGGTSLPQPEVQYNNQGVTLLDGATSGSPDQQVLLEVPDNCILAIDGILKGMQNSIGNNPPLYHTIRTVQGGKILIEGYLENVQLEGNIKMGDLIIKNDPRFIRMSGTLNEIFGNIYMLNRSCLEISNGKTIMYPGSSIKMDPAFNQGLNFPYLNITSTGIFEMSQGTVIESNYCMIQVEQGGTIIIKEGSTVNINSNINIYGTLVLEKNSKLYCRGIVFREHGKCIANESAQVFYERENGIKKIGTGKIILENGSEMEVIASTIMADPPFFISEGIELKMSSNTSIPGGKLTVKSGASMITGPINSEATSTIEVNKGGELYFYSADNQISESIIGGNFYTGRFPLLGAYHDQKAKVFGFGYDPTGTTVYNTPPKYDDCDNPQMQYNWIKLKCINESVSVPLDEFLIWNTDFYNIAFTVNNKNIQTIANCTFKTNSSLCSTKISKLNWEKNPINNFLNLWPALSEATIISGSLNIINSTFIDEFLIPWSLTYNFSLDRRIGGISANFFENVTVNNSGLYQFPENPVITELAQDYIIKYHFMNLNSAINTSACTRVNITNCNFYRCNNASSDQYSSVKFCKNTTFLTSVPQSLSGSKFWGTFDNKFYRSQFPVRLMNIYSGQNFRGNLFYDYKEGVFMQDSRAYLGYSLIEGTEEFICAGRNWFESEYSNTPFPINGQNPPTRSDIYFYNYQDLNDFDGRRPLKISCGFNKMGNHITDHVHLFYERPNSSIPNINVDVNINEWRSGNGYLVMKNNDITTDSYTENTSYDRPNTCDEYYPPSAGESGMACVPVLPVSSCDFFARNDGSWPSLFNADTVIDRNFYADLNDFCNGELSCSCYKQKLFDLMQLAVLGDSAKEKLEMISACINAKPSDPVYLYNHCDITEIEPLLGEAYERLGLFDAALNIYYDILTNSHNRTDTTLARWRIMHLEAIIADSTFGHVYDSLMVDYYQRIAHDINSIDSSATTPPPPPPLPRMVIDEGDDNQIQGEQSPVKGEKQDETILAILEQNAPNPFTNETMIVFRLNREADVRLGVHDALGHTIKEVVNQRLRKGRYVYTLQNENMATGVYLYLLTTDGKQIMKKMQLVK